MRLVYNRIYVIKAPIDALVKKDKAPKSTTLRLRSSSSKREGTRIFGAIATATHHLVKLAPLFTRIRQCNDDHEIFRRAGSKARQRKLIELIESNSDSNTVNWATVQPADATSLLKVGRPSFSTSSKNSAFRAT